MEGYEKIEINGTLIHIQKEPRNRHFTALVLLQRSRQKNKPLAEIISSFFKSCPKKG